MAPGCVDCRRLRKALAGSNVRRVGPTLEVTASVRISTCPAVNMSGCQACQVVCSHAATRLWLVGETVPRSGIFNDGSKFAAFYLVS